VTLRTISTDLWGDINMNNISVEDEIDMLEVMERCGYGNWDEIVRKMNGQSRTPNEVQQFYDHKYLMGDLSDVVVHEQPLPLISPLNNPPRPEVRSKSGCRKMAGYNPARADFLIQYDNQAEFLLSTCPGVTDSSDDNLWPELCLSLANCYRDRLIRRHTVNRLVKEQGLVSGQAKLGEDLSNLVSWDKNSWTRLGQVWCSLDLDKMILSLLQEARLKQKILRLQQYRGLGLKLSGSVRVWDKLNRRRIDQQVVTNRATSHPLDIVGLPGYSSLCSGARELCSHLRLSPSVYVRARNIMVEESEVRGGIKLAQARQLVKIDVNKTRKIYDFLIAKGDIKSVV